MKKKALSYGIAIFVLSVLLFAISYVFYVRILDTTAMSEQTERYFSSALVNSESVNMIIAFCAMLVCSMILLVLAAAFMLKPLAAYDKRLRAEKKKRKK